MKFTRSLPNAFSQLYGLTIQATDGVCERTTVLNINVKSCVNPTAYQFKQTKYTFDLREDRSVGAVGSVELQGTGPVSYSINTTAPFAISSSGNIFKKFNGEGICDHFRLEY